VWRQSEWNRASWRYLEVVEGEPLTEEQRETFDHNHAVREAPCGFLFIEVPKREAA